MPITSLRAIRRMTLGMAAALSLAGTGWSTDQLQIDFARSADLLPYEIVRVRELADTPSDPCNRDPLRFPVRVCSIGQEGQTDAEVVVVTNASDNTGQPTGLVYQNATTWTMRTQFNLYSTVDAFGIFRDSVRHENALIATCYHRDSAFVVKRFQGDDAFVSLFLATGVDRTNDGKWIPGSRLLGACDYDHDGHSELFIQVFPGHDHEPRILFCIDLEDLEIEWSLPVAAAIMGRVLPVPAEPDLSVAFVSYGPENGVRDDLFDDQYGYFTTVNRQGQVTGNWVISDSMAVPVLSPASDSTWYLFHTLPMTSVGHAIDSSRRANRLSIINRHGDVDRSTRLDERMLEPLWFSDYKGDGIDELYALTSNQRIMVFSLDLDSLAKSSTTSLGTFLGRAPIVGQTKPAFVFSGQNALEIYSQNLERLAKADTPAESFQPLVFDRNGKLLEFVITSGGKAAVWRIRQRNITDLARIVLWKYQSYVLMLLTMSLLTIAFVNYHRRRAKKNLLLIADQKAELERVHKELREAQETIVAQEKYKQAKDIAGAFAHEIRNALFPAEAACRRLDTPGDSSGSQERSPAYYAATVRDAVRRAIHLTEQISQYTRLEHERYQETVPLRRVIEYVIAANRIPIEDGKVSVKVDCADDLRVVANESQLRIAVNNLLLNSLDALVDRHAPSIRIGARADGDSVVLDFADNGCGIPEDVLPRVFDTFFSTKAAKGTGLGLATVKRITDIYGGSITLASQAGEWTRFTLRFRLAGPDSTTNLPSPQV